MSRLPLFPELDMISRSPGIRKHKQWERGRQLCLFHSRDCARYTMAVIAQTPAWANKKKIAAIYKEARRLTIETRSLHVVDHIVPIHGGIVSGLHNEFNLEPVPYGYNATKSNRWWPNMPLEQMEIF